MTADCPLCGRPTDESRRCHACNTAACGNVARGGLCGASTGGFHAQCCPGCLARAKEAAAGPATLPRRRAGGVGSRAVAEARQLIDTYRPGLFGGQ